VFPFSWSTETFSQSTITLPRSTETFSWSINTLGKSFALKRPLAVFPSSSRSC
jgi:hypothetical protein